MTAAAVEPTRDIVEPTPVPVTPLPVSDASVAIDRFLEGSPLAGMGSVFVAAATGYGIDPRMMPAVSLHESGRCLHHEAAPFNCWGLTTGERTSEGYLVFRAFSNYEEAIWAVSKTYGSYGLPPYAALCKWVSGNASCSDEYPGRVISTMESIR